MTREQADSHVPEQHLERLVRCLFEQEVKYLDLDEYADERAAVLSLFGLLMNRSKIIEQQRSSGATRGSLNAFAETFRKGIESLEIIPVSEESKEHVLAIASFESTVRLEGIVKTQSETLNQDLVQQFLSAVETPKAAHQDIHNEHTFTSEYESKTDKNQARDAEREFIDPGLSSISTRRETVTSARAKRTTDLSDDEIKQSLEEDLLGLVGRMKAYSRNYKEQLTRDNQILANISHKQDKNLSGTDKEMKSLLEFEKMSNELGFWRLLMMGLIAIALFMLTIMFIFFTSIFR